MKMPQDQTDWDYDTITALAYRLCLEEGCRPGDALRYWQEAALWLRYRDIDAERLEAELRDKAGSERGAEVQTARAEEIRLKMGFTFAFRQASFSLPALRAIQPTALGGWRPRQGRPGRSHGGRLQFRTPAS